MPKYYFAIVDKTPYIFNTGVTICVVPVKFWDNNSYMYDQSIGDPKLKAIFDQLNVVETSECVYGYSGTRTFLMKALSNESLLAHNPSFENFVKA